MLALVAFVGPEFLMAVLVRIYVFWAVTCRWARPRRFGTTQRHDFRGIPPLKQRRVPENMSPHDYKFFSANLRHDLKILSDTQRKFTAYKIANIQRDQGNLVVLGKMCYRYKHQYTERLRENVFTLETKVHRQMSENLFPLKAPKYRVIREPSIPLELP